MAVKTTEETELKAEKEAVSPPAPPKESKAHFEPEFYTVRDLAQKLNYTTEWLTVLCRTGRIKAIKTTGGHYRIPKDEAERIMKEGLPPKPRKSPVSDDEVESIKISPDKVGKVIGKKQEAGSKESGFFDFLFE